MNAKAKARELQGQILHFIWLGEPGQQYTVIDLGQEFAEVTPDRIRRALHWLEAEGLLACEQATTTKSSWDQNDLTWHTNEHYEKRYFKFTAAEKPQVRRVAARWSITEKGIERVMES